MVEGDIGYTEQLISLILLPSFVISCTVLVTLLCDKHERFGAETSGTDIEEYELKRRAHQKRKKKMKEQRRVKEGLKKGTLRPADQNETINEVASNWGPAQAMGAVKRDDGPAQAMGAAKQDDYYKTPSEGGRADEGAPEEPSHPPKLDPVAVAPEEGDVRKRNDFETLDECVSNWGPLKANDKKKNS